MHPFCHPGHYLAGWNACVAVLRVAPRPVTWTELGSALAEVHYSGRHTEPTPTYSRRLGFADALAVFGDYDGISGVLRPGGCPPRPDAYDPGEYERDPFDRDYDDRLEHHARRDR